MSEAEAIARQDRRPDPACRIVLRVASINAHGLLAASRHRAARMTALGECLRELDPDVVGIQEAFVRRDRAGLIEQLAGSRLQHAAYYRSGFVGSGLLIASAHPILDERFHRFSRNGKWYKPWHGDWWAGKGVALARIGLPGGTTLDFYNLHAHARYRRYREYYPDRLAQMREVREFVTAMTGSSTPALIVGDFNCGPAMSEFGTLVDSDPKFVRLHGGAIDHVLAPTGGEWSHRPLSRRTISPSVSRNGRTLALSDHPMLLASVHLSRPSR